MIHTLLQAGQYPLQFAICILLAFIPAVAWFFIFGKRHKHKMFHVGLTFVAGMAAGGVILMYQYFWGQKIEAVFFSIEFENFRSNIEASVGSAVLAAFLVFLSIGFLEEFLKHWMVKKADHRIFESVDDVIEFSIIGALGFAFLENIAYFFRLVVEGNFHNITSLFLMRSVFVVFIHVLCSGIYGYYYGVGFFATPMLKEREKAGKHNYIPKIIHQVLHLKKSTVFREEMATMGLLIAMVVHGIYNFVLNMNFYIGTFFGEEFYLHTPMMPIILVVGFAYLNHLLNKKEDQKRFGHLEEKFVVSS